MYEEGSFCAETTWEDTYEKLFDNTVWRSEDDADAGDALTLSCDSCKEEVRLNFLEPDYYITN